MCMTSESTIPRRRFLGQMCGAAEAASLSLPGHAAAAESGPDQWIKEVKGEHRCLFDFPQHKNGMPLLHILNYLNTYSAAYKVGPGRSAPSARSTASAARRALRSRSTTRSGRSTGLACTRV